MNNNIIISLLTITLAALPALAIYGFLPGTSLGMFFMIVFSLGALWVNKYKFISKDEVKLLLSILVLSFISMIYHIFNNSVWFDVTLLFHNLYSIFLCFIPLVFVVKGISVKSFVITLYILGILASIVVIWQRLSLITTGTFDNNTFLPWFSVSRDLETMSINRPSAFFTEPAHLCIFLLPIFYITLLSRKYIFSGLFLFGILCSGSTTGFLMVVILIIYDVYHKGGKRRYGRMLFSVALSLLAYLVIIKVYPQIFAENIEKLYEIQEGRSGLRLLDPLRYILSFDGFENLVGITLNQLANFLKYKGYRLGGSNINYANGIIYMMISYGLVGFCTLLVYLKKKWRYCRFNKGFLLIFIGVLCSDQILFNAHFLYLASFVMVNDSIVTYLSYNSEVAIKS